MTDTGGDTILLDLFRTNGVRERLLATAVAGLELPPEDYPFYVLIGAEGPWTPTAWRRAWRCRSRPSSSGSRGSSSAATWSVTPNPDDRRSYLVALTGDGRELLQTARPRFRALATAVERRLGDERVGSLRGALAELREAIEAELSSE